MWRRGLVRGRRADRLHVRRAVFELGNFAEGIERRIGKQVRGGFGETEGREDQAVGHAGVHAHRQFDGAAPCRDANPVPRLDLH